MYLETEAAKVSDIDAVDFTAMEMSQVNRVYSTDWAPLIPMLQNKALPVPERAARFHCSLAHSLLNQALAIRNDRPVDKVALSGGVFQIRVLTRQVTRLLKHNGFDVTLPSRVPVKDGGICVGQIVESGYRKG